MPEGQVGSSTYYQYFTILENIKIAINRKRITFLYLPVVYKIKNLTIFNFSFFIFVCFANSADGSQINKLKWFGKCENKGIEAYFKLPTSGLARVFVEARLERSEGSSQSFICFVLRLRFAQLTVRGTASTELQASLHPAHFVLRLHFAQLALRRPTGYRLPASSHRFGFVLHFNFLQFLILHS